MNILALNWQDLKNPMSGGAEVHLEELLRRLVRKGHTVTLFCSNFAGGAREETVEGIRIIRTGNRYNFNLIAPFHIRRLVRRERFDLFLEDINKIPFYTPWYLDLPSIVVIPHLFSTAVFEEINFVLGSYIYLMERPLRRVYRGKRFCVISESTMADLVSRGIAEKDITVIHCGLDRSVYGNRKGYAKYDYPSVLYLGRIKKYKSIQHLIAAFALVRRKIPNARLRIVGTGDYLPALKCQAQELHLAEAVEFTGFVSSDTKVEYMCRSHLMVYPSLREGWGLTNIEANSCGTAVVAADSPGLRDSVRDGVSGLLYPYGDIEQLADRIIVVLSDPDRRRQLEKGGLEWAAQFDWDIAAEHFLKVCLDTAGKQ
ncbi:MAG: glycosyltransferase family 4 protein [candidate division Zixibacteria bacterium]|nr:glycosyltransferase family 4 protein [candidate division Zixibacteria bacterium]